MPEANLSKPSTACRLFSERGLPEIELAEDEKRIDREGGKFGAGIIRGFSVITVGEALGHDLWCDEETLQQVCEKLNALSTGLKMRFNHPGMSGDSLGSAISRAFNARVAGNRVVADMHFTKAAHASPKGDLAEYLMALAEEDPEAFGTSIVFTHDGKAMREFSQKHTVKGQGFVSPDPSNVKNYPHVRITKLRAVDAVDTPAANPGGLFSAESEVEELLQDGDEVLDYVFGFSQETPVSGLFGVHSTRIKDYVARYFSQRGLKFEVQEMPKEETILEVAPEVEKTPEPAPVETTLSTPPVTEDKNAELKRFVSAFGAENGTKWLLERLSFDAALQAHCDLLKAENAELKGRINKSKVELGEKPVSAQPEGDGREPAEDKALSSAIGSNLSRFAKACRIPSRN